MRFHVPSYLVPGTWLENLRRAESLAWVSGMELLFFVYDEDARGILKRDRSGMAEFAERFHLTLHLPDRLEPSVEELIDLTRPFVRSYVVHSPPDPSDLDSWAGLVESWRATYGRDFYLENTGASGYSRALLLFPDIELCADCGRLLLDGENPASWIKQRGDRVHELHVHGLAEGRDHAVLQGRELWLTELAPSLRDFSGPVELEVFSLEGVERTRRGLMAALGETMEDR